MIRDVWSGGTADVPVKEILIGRQRPTLLAIVGIQNANVVPHIPYHVVYQQFSIVTKIMLADVLVAILFVSSVVAQTSNDTSVVAVFLLGRHGDRTAKVGPGIEGNSLLTTLGKQECYDSGSFFRNRYLNSASPDFIEGVETDYVNTQITAMVGYGSISTLNS
jgi:hypothetical protein